MSEMKLKKEVRPIGNRILIELMEENPYLASTTDTGLKITNGQFENPDSGDIDVKQFPVRCGEVIECGSTCTETRPGDHVLVVMNSLMPVPFRGRLFFCVGEANVVAVLADDFTNR